MSCEYAELASLWSKAQGPLERGSRTSSSHPAIGFTAVTDESDADSDNVFSSIAHASRIGSEETY